MPLRDSRTVPMSKASPRMAWTRSRSAASDAVKVFVAATLFSGPARRNNELGPTVRSRVLPWAFMIPTVKAVSYTHLRAHETRHDLVCRLLLEKKKKKKNTNIYQATTKKKNKTKNINNINN